MVKAIYFLVMMIAGTVVGGLALPAAASGLSSPQSQSYSQYAKKAERYFNNREWRNAQAILQIMSTQRPEVADTYSRGMVVAAMCNDTISEIDFLERALKAGIDPDTVFNNVETISFSIGQTDLYECSMLLAQSVRPELSKLLERRLLDYYIFRRDGEGMIGYSRRLLDSKESECADCRLTEAIGFMFTGEIDKAESAFQQIVENSPDSKQAYQALLYLAFMSDNDSQRVEMLRRAYQMNPTPYVGKLLGQ